MLPPDTVHVGSLWTVHCMSECTSWHEATAVLLLPDIPTVAGKSLCNVPTPYCKTVADCHCHGGCDGNAQTHWHCWQEQQHLDAFPADHNTFAITAGWDWNCATSLLLVA